MAERSAVSLTAVTGLAPSEIFPDHLAFSEFKPTWRSAKFSLSCVALSEFGLTIVN